MHPIVRRWHTVWGSLLTTLAGVQLVPLIIEWPRTELLARLMIVLVQLVLGAGAFVLGLRAQNKSGSEAASQVETSNPDDPECREARSTD